MRGIVIVQWKNKYSGEIGYVGKINKKKRYFENARDRDGARTWLNASMAEHDIAFLTEAGEAENNDFTIIPV